jgi:hypothetical protein
VKAFQEVFSLKFCMSFPSTLLVQPVVPYNLIYLDSAHCPRYA